MRALKILTVLAVAVVFSFLYTAASIAAEGNLTIQGMQGAVMVKISPATDWIPAKIGMTIKGKDAVKTGADGIAILQFPSKTSLALKPNSEAIIEDLAWEAAAKKVGVNLTAGELRNIIQKVDSPSEFTVKTPTAISGARGTIYYLRVNADGTTIVYVQEGTVDVNGVAVGAGMISTVGADGSVTPPRPATPEEINSFISGWGVMIVGETFTEAMNERTNEIESPAVTPEKSTDNTNQSEKDASAQ